MTHHRAYHACRVRIPFENGSLRPRRSLQPPILDGIRHLSGKPPQKTPSTPIPDTTQPGTRQTHSSGEITTPLRPSAREPSSIPLEALLPLPPHLVKACLEEAGIGAWRAENARDIGPNRRSPQQRSVSAAAWTGLLNVADCGSSVKPPGQPLAHETWPHNPQPPKVAPAAAERPPRSRLSLPRHDPAQRTPR